MDTTRDRLEDAVTDGDLLAFARARRVAADAAEVDVLLAGLAWADAHPAGHLDDAETLRAGRSGGLLGGYDTGLGLGGPGCPLVAEFSVAEFAAAVGMGTEAGKHLIGQGLELRHRLRGIWARVVAGEVPVWRARRVAEQTIRLGVEAAAYVDRHLVPVVHTAPVWQLNRLVDVAVARFMPEEADRVRERALDRRHVEVHTDAPIFAGTAVLEGELDLPDALELDQVLARGAAVFKGLGSTESLDVRRCLALAELARAARTGQAAFGFATDTDFDTGTDTDSHASHDSGDGGDGGDGGAGDIGDADDIGTGDSTDSRTGSRTDGTDGTDGSGGGSGRAETSTSAGTETGTGPRIGGAWGARPGGAGLRLGSRREVVLYVHLSEDAVLDATVEAELARLEGPGVARGTVVTADTVRAWLMDSGDLSVTVKPVIDLRGHVHTEAYEVPERIKERVRLRDHTCVFPWCTRPARRADCDHVRAWNRGDTGASPTCTCNLAPLCRSHHRLKTHGHGRTRWSYTVVDDGGYLWHSPTGLAFLRDHTGTHQLTQSRPASPAAGPAPQQPAPVAEPARH